MMLVNRIGVVTKEPPGTIIKRIRLQDPNRNQEEFAGLLGVSRGTIANWETSGILPDAVNLAKILALATEEHRWALLEALGSRRSLD